MHGQALVAAAIAAFQRGDLARARSLAEQRLAEASPLPLMQHLIGLIECRSGRLDSGIEWLSRASGAEPENIGFRIILARALIDGGRAREALDVATPSEAAPLELWHARAEAAFAAGEPGIESDAWQGICTIRPHDPIAWTNLASSLFAQNRYDEAEAAYREALRIVPTHVAALRGLGLTLERTNQLGPLRELLGLTLKAGIPKRQLADLWALRELRRRRGGKAWSLVHDMDTAADPVRLNELRAKAADAAGRPREAFAAATAMNRATPGYEAWLASGRDFRRQLRGVCEAMTSWPAHLPTAPPTHRATPVFLVGFPRSGTTLADTFLMGHPEVRVLEEAQMLAPAARALPTSLDLPDLELGHLEGARAVYYAEMDRHFEGGNQGLVIDKLPLNMFSLPLIGSLFPDARVIFMQRHPCDCVLSAFMQHFALNAAMASFLELVDSADLFDAGMSLFTRARDRSQLAIHTLAYEELIADPESALRPAVEFLGLEWRPELLDHRATAVRRGAIATPSYSQVGQELTKYPSGRWRRYQKQLTPILPILLPWARRLGYAD